MTEQKTLGVRPEQKEKLEEARAYLEGLNGYKPTQGETIAIACQRLMEGNS